MNLSLIPRISLDFGANSTLKHSNNAKLYKNINLIPRISGFQINLDALQLDALGSSLCWGHCSFASLAEVAKESVQVLGDWRRTLAVRFSEVQLDGSVAREEAREAHGGRAVGAVGGGHGQADVALHGDGDGQRVKPEHGRIEREACVVDGGRLVHVEHEAEERVDAAADGAGDQHGQRG